MLFSAGSPRYARPDPPFFLTNHTDCTTAPLFRWFRHPDNLRRLRQDKKTIILSAHNLYQVEAICDKVIMLRRGKIAAFGTMKELREPFGSLTYKIFISIDDPAKLLGHSKTYRPE